MSGDATLAGEFVRRAAERGVALPWRMETGPVFGDLHWGGESLEEILAAGDPYVAWRSTVRWVVFQPLRGDVCYFAAPYPLIEAGEVRVAGDNEIGPYELGVVGGVDDAIDLTAAYLDVDPSGHGRRELVTRGPRASRGGSTARRTRRSPVMPARTEIRTDRLLLCPFRAGDEDDELAYRDDPEFARYLPHIPQPFTRADAAAFVA